MSRVPPELISIDNQAEDAWLELRCERARELFIATQMQESGRTRGEVESIVNEFFPPPETDSEADRKFSWAGVIALLAVAGVVMLLTYWAVEGF